MSHQVAGKQYHCPGRWLAISTFEWPPLKRALPCQEDEAVRKLVDKHGDKSWVLVASFLPNRTGKQIRERWHNQLDPMIMKGPARPHLFRPQIVERAFLNPRTFILSNACLEMSPRASTSAEEKESLVNG